MADDVLARQYVEFVQRGLDNINDLTSHFRTELEKADKASRLLQDAMSSGVYSAFQGQMTRINAEMEKLRYNAEGGLRGEVVRGYASELKKAEAEAAKLADGLSSGAFAEHAQKMAIVNEQTRRSKIMMAQLEEQARRTAAGYKTLGQAMMAHTTPAFAYRPEDALRSQMQERIKQTQTLADGMKRMMDSGQLSPLSKRQDQADARLADQRIRSMREEVANGSYLARQSARFAQDRQMANVMQMRHNLDLIAQYGTLGGRMMMAGEKAQALSTKLRYVGYAGMAGFGLFSGSLVGFARSGFSGTIEMTQFSFALQLIGREVAGLFVPAMRTATEWLQRISRALRSMTGDQQESLRRWLMMGAAVTGFAAVMPRAIGMAGGLMTSLGQLAPALSQVMGMSSAGGPWAMLAVAGGLAQWGAVAAVFAGVLSYSREARVEFGAMLKEFRSLGQELQPVFKFAMDGVTGMVRATIASMTSFLRTLQAMIRQAQEAYMFAKALRGDTMLAGPIQQLQAQSKRDQVSLDQAGPESLEATFDRMQTAVLRLNAGNQTKSTDQLQTEALVEIKKKLMEWDEKMKNPPAPPLPIQVGGALLDSLPGSQMVKRLF